MKIPNKTSPLSSISTRARSKRPRASSKTSSRSKQRIRNAVLKKRSRQPPRRQPSLNHLMRRTHRRRSRSVPARSKTSRKSRRRSSLPATLVANRSSPGGPWPPPEEPLLSARPRLPPLLRPRARAELLPTEREDLPVEVT